MKKGLIAVAVLGLLAARTPVLDALQVQPAKAQPTTDAKAPDTPAKQVIPSTVEPKVTQTQPACAGDTSQALTSQAWDALSHDKLALALACTSRTTTTWHNQADEQQAKEVEKGCPQPQAAMKEAYFAKNWALSDVGASLFIRGEALEKLGRTKEARAAYDEIMAKYDCAWVWDPRGWFWKPAKAAGERLANLPQRMPVKP